MSAFLRNLFSRSSPPVGGTVDNGGKVSSSPNHSETEKTNRLVKSAPSVLQNPHEEIPQIDARSLVNDFNQQQQQQQQVPPTTPITRIRTLADTQVDVIEYYCHLCLMETDPVQLVVLQQELAAALVVQHPRHSSQMHTWPNYGRLYNRLHIVSLWNDMGCMRIEGRGPTPVPVEAAAAARLLDRNVHIAQGSRTARSVEQQDGADETVDTSRRRLFINDSTDISAAQWTQITEQLVLVRGHLLRLDANLAVSTLPPVPATTARNDENEHPDNAVTDSAQIASNEQVANYDMFQQDYQHVVLLLQVQRAMACLYESLEYTNMDGNAESCVQCAAEACQESLVRIFENQENGRGLPESLSLLVYRNSYQKRNGPDIHGNHETGADLMRQDVTDICLDETHEFSHARLKAKMHALLIQWSNSILDVPTLVQLGYGGVTIPVAGNRGDDAASLDREEEPGQNVGDDQPLLTQSQSHLENRQHAAQEIPPTDDVVHINTDDSYGDDQPLMETQSQNRSENVQQAVQHNAKNDFACDEDPDDISEQEGSGGGGLARVLSGWLTKAAERDREKQCDVSEKVDRHDQRGFVPSADLLLESTDVVFNEITDPDTVTVTDIHGSLRKRYGFKLGQTERVLVEKRLTELMNATNNLSTATKDSFVATEHASNSYTTTANRAVSIAARKRALSSDDSDDQYPPRLSFKATDRTASAKPNNALSAERADCDAAADLETTDDDDDFTSRRQKRPLVVIDVDNKRRAMPEESRASDKPAHVHVNLWSDSDASVNSAGPNPVLSRHAFSMPSSKNHTNRKTGRWSEEEVEAVRQGVASFGIGKWVEIRNHSNGQLFRRTGVQIKDKYRQMCLAGKL